MRPTPARLSNSLRGLPEEWDVTSPPAVADVLPPPPLSWRKSSDTGSAPQAVLPRACPCPNGLHDGVTYTSAVWRGPPANVSAP